MPPRHAYWTILVDDQPTAFRAHDAEELLPTLNRLKDKNPSAVMKWFERGQLFDSRDAARDAGGGEGERRWEGPRPGDDAQRDGGAAAGERRARSDADAARPPRRGKTWRPGGEHKDPRQKYIDAKKAKWNRYKQNIRDRVESRDERSSGTGEPPIPPQAFSPPHGDPLRDQVEETPPIERDDRPQSQEGGYSDSPARLHGDKLREKVARSEGRDQPRSEWRPREEQRDHLPRHDGPSDHNRGARQSWDEGGGPANRNNRGGGGDRSSGWRPSGPARDRGGYQNRDSRRGGDDRGGARGPTGPPRDRDDRGGSSGGWRPSGPPRNRDDRGSSSGGWSPGGPTRDRENRAGYQDREWRGGGDDRRGSRPPERPWQGPPRDREDRGNAPDGWRPSGPPRDRGGSSGGWRPSGPPRDRDDRGGYQNRESRGGGDDRRGGRSSERPWQGPPRDREDRGNAPGGWRPSGPPRGRDDRGGYQNRDSGSGSGFGDRKPAGGFGKKPWESRGAKPASGGGARKPWGGKPDGRKPWRDGPGNRPPAGERPPKRRRDEDE